MDFKPNARGNWYKSQYGIMVHRLDSWDAQLAGVPHYHPDTGAAITPEEDRALAPDKTAWDRNFALKFIIGGSAAVSLTALARAMEQGRGQCLGVNITEEVAA